MRNNQERIYTKTCSRCQKVWQAGMVLACKHPKVRSVFGENICMYCCKRCKHRETFEYMDGVRCGYKEGDDHV